MKNADLLSPSRIRISWASAQASVFFSSLPYDSDVNVRITSFSLTGRTHEDEYYPGHKMLAMERYLTGCSPVAR